MNNLLKNFGGSFPKELPRNIPPKRTVNHEIDLEPGHSPPSRPPYRLSQPHLDELQTQLSALLERGFIKPSKSPFGASVFFVHNDSLWHPLHTKAGDEISMFWGSCLQSSISTLSFSFWALFFFAMQLALVSMITITPTLSLSVFSLQRTRLFRTCGELWRTRGELWLYFEMQRRLDLWSFSWSSRRSREAQK